MAVVSSEGKPGNTPKGILPQTYRKFQENPDLIGDELNFYMSYFDVTQYDTELVECIILLKRNPALQSGEDVINYFN